MIWKIPLADLNYDSNEDTAVLSVLHSKWLTMGEVTSHFEQSFSALTSSPHCLTVSNATEALHLACVALGIGPGDEVIVPSLTFVATANAVLYTGARVTFADITGPNDLTISPASIQAAITPRTKAIIVMHYAGYPYTGYWQDLGHPDDYEQAVNDFDSLRHLFLPNEKKD